MTCAETEILLHALLDGELDAGHARDVEAHLEGCPRCAAQFRAHREMQQAMSAAQSRYTAPMSLRHRIERALPSAPKRVSNLRSVLKGFVMGTALSTALAASLVIAVADVDEAQARFERFTARPAATAPSGRTIKLDRGRIDLVTSAAFADAYPEIAIPALPFMGAYGVTVRSLDVAEAVMRKGGLSGRRTSDRLVVPYPEALGHGAWLFTASAAGAAQ